MSSVLWTDIIDPAELTGYVRRSLEEFETSQGTLARYLPNREVNDIVARFTVTQEGLVPVAEFRAYDAEPDRGTGEKGERVTIDLPALGETQTISELDQIRQRNASDEAQLRTITRQGDRVVRAVVNAMEYQRGVALMTGKQTINGRRFKSDDDFGRSAAHDVVAPTLFTDTAFDRLGYLESLCDVYEATNGGERPGVILMSRAVWRAFKAGDQFQTQLINGGARRPTDGEVMAYVEGEGLPPIEVYERRVKLRNGTTVPVIGSDSLLLLPAPVDVNDFEATDLGASFWGRTLTSDDPDWGIADADAPGIVAGVYRNKRPPMIAEVVSDAIGLPVLAHANLSLRARVL